MPAEPVAGPLPVWFTAAQQDRQFDAGNAGGWGPNEVFAALHTDPTDDEDIQEALLVAPPVWVGEKHYFYGQRVLFDDSPVSVGQVVTSGVSGATAPTPASEGNTFQDGGVLWRRISWSGPVA